MTTSLARRSVADSASDSATHLTNRVRLGVRISLAVTTVAMLSGAAGLGTSDLASGGIASSSLAAGTAETCEGVTVVVDFTDTGGELTIACAEGEQASGRSALLAAGFTTTDSQPGLLCAINATPDPCPETFDGNFWSYWNSTPTTEWTSYQVGADSSTPAPGSIEGWRYNDGSTAPGIAPGEVAAALAASASTSSPDTSGEQESTEGPEASDHEAVTTSAIADEGAEQLIALTVTVVAVLALLAALAVYITVRRRRSTDRSAHHEVRD